MPKRKGTGSLHDDTIRSPKGILIDEKTGIVSANPNRSSFIRKRLQDVKIADLENSILKQSDKLLYQQLENLLEANGDDPKKPSRNLSIKIMLSSIRTGIHFLQLQQSRSMMIKV